MRDLTTSVDFMDAVLTTADKTGALNPGAKDKLMDEIRSLKGADSPEDVFAEYVDRFYTPEGRMAYLVAGSSPEEAQNRRLRDIAARLPAPGNAAKSLGGSPPLEIAPTVVLRELLDWMPLKKGSANALYEKWAMRVAGMTPKRVAEFVATELRSRDNDEHLARRPALDTVENRVLSALEIMRDEFAPGVNLEQLARDWRDCGGLGKSVGKIAEAIGHRLRTDRGEHLRRYADVANIDAASIDEKLRIAEGGVSPNELNTIVHSHNAEAAERLPSNVRTLLKSGRYSM